jgi:hypothetical protein
MQVLGEAILALGTRVLKRLRFSNGSAFGEAWDSFGQGFQTAKALEIHHFFLVRKRTVSGTGFLKPFPASDETWLPSSHVNAVAAS